VGVGGGNYNYPKTLKKKEERKEKKEKKKTEL
jgi:hypothetical protein